MKTKQQLKKEIAKLECQLNDLIEKEDQEMNKANWFQVGDYEYETKEHDFNNKLSSIKIPKGYRLWTSEECITFHNDPKLRKILNLEDCWFFIQQPFAFNQLNNLVAWFYAYSGRAVLGCDGGPTYADASLGVRFARKKFKEKP